jgi:hypothetical protein
MHVSVRAFEAIVCGYRLLLSELLAQTGPAHRNFLDLEMAAELAAAMGAAMN